MSSTYRRQRRQKIHKQIGKVNKRMMIDSLVANNIRIKHPSISEDNIMPMARFLGFFVWLFSYPYDYVKKAIILHKYHRQSRS